MTQNFLHALCVWGKDKAGRKLLLCWCLAPGCGKTCIVRADNMTQTATTGNKNSTSCGCVRKESSRVRGKYMAFLRRKTAKVGA